MIVEAALVVLAEVLENVVLFACTGVDALEVVEPAREALALVLLVSGKADAVETAVEEHGNSRSQQAKSGKPWPGYCINVEKA